ncbi:ATP-dependent nuclease [Pediococcus acidilactici]|uniref:ATP-dependent nuclease n=1 Tax=Pediococcus acidilactici TaxID=1254 RepID=UPI002AFDFBBB|nr:AAA family ATPase [Pediococcus acidilactici]WQS12080.1 AAA family ATPase [Pediococcus acidilactici]
MKKLQISKIEIKNFRAIKHSTIHLDKETILVGKNNIGKSSILDAFSKFNNNLDISDINIDLLIHIMNLKNNPEQLSNDDCICLRITYDWDELESEYWSLLSEISDSGETVIELTYAIPVDNYPRLKKCEQVSDLLELFVRNVKIGSVQDFLNNTASYLPASAHLNKLLPLPVYNLESVRPGELLLYPIMAFRYVVDGKNSNTDATAKQFSTKISDMIGEDIEVQKLFKSMQTDVDNTVAPKMDTFQEELKSFAYPKDPDNPLKAILTIDEWMNNPSIRIAQTFEKLEGFELPLKSQGLGYQNIYNIIARISALFAQMDALKLHNPVCFAIEEPEAFTHPQLQHIFVQQIREFVAKQAESLGIPFQLVLISHSPEIAVSAFEMGFQIVIGRKSSKNTRFINWNKVGNGKSRDKLKKLILNYNAELLFADKIIAYEGDAERLTITAMIRKCAPKLLSEKIAFIPVGTSFPILAPAISDLDYQKILLITDIDFKMNALTGEPQKLEEITTTNSNLKYLNKHPEETKVTDINLTNKFRNKETKIYATASLVPEDTRIDHDDNFMVTTQGYNSNYKFWPRTLESAIVSASTQNFNLYSAAGFLKSDASKNIQNNPSLLNLVDKYLLKKRKADFALDGLDLIASPQFTVPEYISSGLEWLVKNEK